MSLMIHAQAARIMAEAFGRVSADCGDDANALLLTRMSQAYGDAANEMEGTVRAEIGAINHACTLDHKAMKGLICPACGAKR